MTKVTKGACRLPSCLGSHKTDDYEKSSRRFLFFMPVGWDNTAVWFVAAEIKTKVGCILR